MIEIDFDAAYKVVGYGGVAWRAVRYETAIEWFAVGEYEEWGYDDYEEVVNEERVVCVMIGDDREFTFDVDDLTKIDEKDYCPGCGQIGCRAYG